MNVTELRVFYPPYFPAVSSDCRRFPTLHPSALCQFPGLLVEIITLLAQELNLKIIPETNESLGIDDANIQLLELGTMLLNGTLDVVAMGLQKTEYRESIFRFSEALYIVGTQILMQKKERKFEKLWAFFETYSSRTWFAFAASCLAQWAFCVLVRRFEAYRTKQKAMSAMECAWQVVRLQLLQPEEITFRSGSGSFSMCLFSVFNAKLLLGVFGSFILASIIRPPPKVADPIVALLKSVENGENVLLTNDPRNWFYEHINKSELFPYTEIRRALESNPFRVVATKDAALELVANSNAIMFQQTDEGTFHRAYSYCTITAMHENMPKTSAHLMLRPFHPLFNRLNWAIGINQPKIQSLVTKYYERAKWNVECLPQSSFSALSLAPYTGVGIVVFGLFGLAFLVLTAEIGVERIRLFFDLKLQPLVKHRKLQTS